MSEPTKQALSQLQAQLTAHLAKISPDATESGLNADDLSEADSETLNDIMRELSRLTALLDELGDEVHEHLDKRPDVVDEAPKADAT